jgi:hypothetical protein
MSLSRIGWRVGLCVAVLVVASGQRCDLPMEGLPCVAAGADPCGPGEFCKLDVGECSYADAVGICTVTPDACTEIFAPVCGCDGETYANACFADAAGVNVATEGECP